MTTIVVPKTGYYVVGTLDAQGLHTAQVDKQKQCTCGGTAREPCVHIRAVATYLQLGGERAPAEPATPPELPEACPLCGSAVIPQGQHWRCTASASHYWQWRGEQHGVRAFLTQAHPAKQGAFYEQTVEERDAFLEQIGPHRTGYSPYR